ncbi:MAG: nucleoside triphosphate pyrophosphohydrolase [Dehalococcoidia bacterium]|nr:nucleoside triphosphate pyrophosphohydrolase [Dehalococcoidia bacterium]
MPPYASLRSFGTLKRIVARLRGPRGCPWDRAKTPASLKPSFLEEAYEVLEAIEKDDPAALKDELGDLMLHVMLQAQMASEAGRFTIEDVLEGINRKLIHRHPHVFGNAKVGASNEVVANWEALKREERPEARSLMDSVPPHLPALAQADSLQRRAASVGFDWPDVSGILAKLVEEVSELEKASPETRAKEFGDVLFTLVNIARRWDVDLESALRQANRRFADRFRCMEELTRQRNLEFEKLTLEEKDALWEEAKKKVG